MAKSKLYTATFTLPDGKRKYVRAKTKEELERKVTQMKMEMRAGVDISDNTTFGEFAQLWVDTYRRPHLKEGGIRDLLHTLNQLVMPTLAGMKLKDVKPMHIARMMSDISEYSHRSQMKALAATRAIFDAAVDNGLIVRSPVAKDLRAGGDMPEEKVPLTPEQCDRLLSAVEGTRAYVPVVLMLGLGLRREEALALMWSDIHFDEHFVHVCRTNTLYDNQSVISTDMKSRAAIRDVPLAPWVERALREAQAVSGSLYVAPGTDGRPMTKSSYNSMWRIVTARIAHTPEELGTSPKHAPWVVRSLDFHVHAHLLRHTCATRWVEQGFNPKEIQYMLGHSSPDLSMKIYAHYDAASRFSSTVERMQAQG